MFAMRVQMSRCVFEAEDGMMPDTSDEHISCPAVGTHNKWDKVLIRGISLRGRNEKGSDHRATRG